MAKGRSTYGVKRVGQRWQARPYVPGRGKLYAGTWDTQEEATKAAIRKIEEERRLPVSKETVATFAARWVKDFPRPKDSTNDRYRADAARFAKHAGESVKLHEIDKPTARKWAQAHPHDHGALRAMFADAEREGLITANSNPFSALRISKGRGRRDISPITAEELGRLGEIAEQTHGKDYGPIFRSVIVFAAYTGLRPSEVFGLDRDDVDLQAETVHVRRQFHKRRLTSPKNGKQRTVFLPPPAAEAIKSMPPRVPRPVCHYSGTQMLFPGKLGQRITQSALTSYWKPVRLIFEATLDDRRRRELRESSQSEKAALDFYALRHFCATYLVEQGVESWIVARQLGHEDGGRLVEKTYGHPRDEVARQRLRQVFEQNVKPLRAVEGDAGEATG